MPIPLPRHCRCSHNAIPWQSDGLQMEMGQRPDGNIMARGWQRIRPTSGGLGSIEQHNAVDQPCPIRTNSWQNWANRAKSIGPNLAEVWRKLAKIKQHVIASRPPTRTPPPKSEPNFHSLILTTENHSSAPPPPLKKLPSRAPSTQTTQIEDPRAAGRGDTWDKNADWQLIANRAIVVRGCAYPEVPRARPTH